EAVLAALGLPRGWQKRLARAFGSPEMIAAALADLANPPASGVLADRVAALAAAGDRAALAAHVAAEMDVAGLSRSAGRTPDEIARRLLEKTELARVRLPEAALRALRGFLAIHVPLNQAVETLDSFARASGIDLGAALDTFSARAAAMSGHGLEPDAISYDAAFGRPLDYYTGLVFEITAEGSPRVLAGGGRFDRLLTLLGAEKPIPGVGFSVWLDRIEALRETRP
ncbi:MAG: ATP phosphoribosyltransferase regulatory subunit, partial [Mesorhizobium sp.]|nr:ATP phosphoribosyltransferase regulatory subunit [Mesorhizobium sp.]